MNSLLRFLYASILILSGTLTLTGLHTAVIRYFARNFPDTIAAALPGAFNIAWYEIGYAIGRSLNTVPLFESIPYIGGTASLVSAFFLFTRSRRSRAVVLANLWLTLLLTLLAAVLPLVAGGTSMWRLVTFAAGLATNTGWLWFTARSKHLRSDS